MDFATVIERLRNSLQLLTVADLTAIFNVHFSTINRWLDDVNFPRPVRLERRRMFRPDELLAWAQSQADQEREMLTCEEVCERVGVLPKAFSKWVKQGHAPEHRRRAIGSGAYLWDAKEVEAWLLKETGGFPRPKPKKPAVRIEPAPRGRRGRKPMERLHAAAL